MAAATSRAFGVGVRPGRGHPRGLYHPGAGIPTIAADSRRIQLPAVGRHVRTRSPHQPAAPDVATPRVVPHPATADVLVEVSARARPDARVRSVVDGVPDR